MTPSSYTQHILLTSAFATEKKDLENLSVTAPICKAKRLNFNCLSDLIIFSGLYHLNLDHLQLTLLSYRHRHCLQTVHHSRFSQQSYSTLATALLFTHQPWLLSLPRGEITGLFSLTTKTWTVHLVMYSVLLNPHRLLISNHNVLICLSWFLFSSKLLLFCVLSSVVGEVVYWNDWCWKSLQCSQQAVCKWDPGVGPAVHQRWGHRGKQEKTIWLCSLEKISHWYVCTGCVCWFFFEILTFQRTDQTMCFTFNVYQLKEHGIFLCCHELQCSSLKCLFFNQR